MGSSYHSHDIDHELEGCCLDCSSGLDSVKHHLIAFHNRIVTAPIDPARQLSFDDVRELYAELDDVVRLHDPSDRFVESLLHDPEVAKVIPDLRHAYSAYFQTHETEFAKELLAAGDPWSALERFVFYPNYVSLTDAEVALAGLGPDDTVAFIGCGPLPLTAIMLTVRHSIECVAFEHDAELAHIATQVVERLGVGDSVRVVHADHTRISDEGQFDLVMIAAQAGPRRQVLDHLTRVMPAGTRILLRTYEKGLRRILAGEEALDLPEHLSLIDTSDPGPSVNNTIILAETLRV